MVLGIGFIGVLTATITSAFLDTGQEARAARSDSRGLPRYDRIGCASSRARRAEPLAGGPPGKTSLSEVKAGEPDFHELEPDCGLAEGRRLPQARRLNRRIPSNSSGAERSDGRTIGWSRQAKGARRQRDHCDCVASHVEELD